MSGDHLSHDVFFQKLEALFESRRSRDHGSVFLTQKRLTPLDKSQADSKEDTLDDLAPLAEPLPILVRAHDGISKPNKVYPEKKSATKTKLSTVVEARDLDSFFTRYAEVCKAGMSALKKRDRKKAKSKKGKGSGKASGGA